jgi:hypothetical protein
MRCQAFSHSVQMPKTGSACSRLQKHGMHVETWCLVACTRRDLANHHSAEGAWWPTDSTSRAASVVMSHWSWRCGSLGAKGVLFGGPRGPRGLIGCVSRGEQLSSQTAERWLRARGLHATPKGLESVSDPRQRTSSTWPARSGGFGNAISRLGRCKIERKRHFMQHGPLPSSDLPPFGCQWALAMRPTRSIKRARDRNHGGHFLPNVSLDLLSPLLFNPAQQHWKLAFVDGL